MAICVSYLKCVASPVLQTGTTVTTNSPDIIEPDLRWCRAVGWVFLLQSVFRRRKQFYSLLMRPRSPTRGAVLHFQLQLQLQLPGTGQHTCTCHIRSHPWRSQSDRTWRTSPRHTHLFITTTSHVWNDEDDDDDDDNNNNNKCPKSFGKRSHRRRTSTIAQSP